MRSGPADTHILIRLQADLQVCAGDNLLGAVWAEIKDGCVRGLGECR